MYNSLILLFVFFVGFSFGCLFTFVFRGRTREESKEFVQNLVTTNKEQQQILFDSYLSRLQSSFKAESLENFQRSTETTFQLTSKQLEQNQKIISQEISTNRGEIEKNIALMLEKVTGLGELVHRVEEKTGRSYGELGALLKQTNEQTKSLVATTTSIKEVLSNSQARGIWGERIAEDVLRHSGLIENIHYQKQVTLESGGRPDFSFMLPEDLYLHMDVKFPLENYRNYLSAQDSESQRRYQRSFIADVKATMKTLIQRAYSDPNSTVGCVLLFIPHKEILSFVQEKSPELIEESMKRHIVLCSPMSLLSVLMVVRKAVDTFKIKKTSQDLIEHMILFKKQWALYTETYENLGKKIKDLDTEFEKLTGTRTRLLSSVIERITKVTSVSEDV